MKKGFTLMELLTTIILIGILALIVVPTVTGAIKNVRNKTLEETINKTEKSLTISFLKQEGYLPDKTYMNPVTGDELNGCVLYYWDKNNSQYILNWSYECN